MNRQIISFSTLSLAAVAVLALVSTATASVDLSKLPPFPSRKTSRFDKDIKPLFEASCTRCHGADRPKAGLRLTTLEMRLKAAKRQGHRSRKSEKSDLVILWRNLIPKPHAAQHARANPARCRQWPGWSGGAGNSGCSSRRAWSGSHATAKPLTPEQVGLVRAWIDQGEITFPFKNNAALKRNSTRQFF